MDKDNRDATLITRRPDSLDMPRVSMSAGGFASQRSKSVASTCTRIAGEASLSAAHGKERREALQVHITRHGFNVTLPGRACSDGS